MDEAIGDFDQAIKLEPKNAAAFRGRAKAYWDKDQPKEALDDCERAIQIDRENAESWLTRAAIYYDREELDKAIEDYKAALKLEPSSFEGFRGRGAAYVDKGEFEKALDDLNEALRIKPKDVASLRYRSRAYLGMNQFAKALADCDEMIGINPNPEAYCARARVHEREKDWAKSIEDYSKAIEKDPNYGEAYAGRAAPHGSQSPGGRQGGPSQGRKTAGEVTRQDRRVNNGRVSVARGKGLDGAPPLARSVPGACQFPFQYKLIRPSCFLTRRRTTRAIHRSWPEGWQPGSAGLLGPPQ